jgi:hypothetical protein
MRPGEIFMSHSKTLAVLGFLTLCPPSVLAQALPGGQSPDGAGAMDRAATKQAKERAAKKACLNGDPVKGVELLTDLYVDSNDPNYIFNQGRCYEQNDRCEDAINRFREYMRKTGSERDRTDAEKHIADCEALLAKKGEETSGSSVALSSAAMPSGSAVSPVQPPPAAVVAETPASRPGRVLRTAGVTTMAVGGAALVAGIVLNLKHNSMLHDLKADYSGDSADTAQTYKVLSMVGYGLGAACLVGGGTLYFLGYRSGKTMVAPTFVAGNAGLSVRGGF